jgi:chemotaxis-related protein WspB
MQLLTFTVAGQDYAIESRRVIEVLPLVPGRPIPCMPSYVLGVFTYRGSLVPLVDLGRRLAGSSPEPRLSTRVVVVEFVPPAMPDHAPVRLGLIAGNVITIRPAGASDTMLPALALPDAPFLGAILQVAGRTVQVVRIEHLLPADLVAGLYPSNVEVRPS